MNHHAFPSNEVSRDHRRPKSKREDCFVVSLESRLPFAGTQGYLVP
jgi:hypothetical protein